MSHARLESALEAVLTLGISRFSIGTLNIEASQAWERGRRQMPRLRSLGERHLSPAGDVNPGAFCEYFGHFAVSGAGMLRMRA